MGQVVYLLCALMSVVCAAMLWRGYLKTRTHLLLWSSLCFGFLALNNINLFIDLVLLPDVDISGVFWRNLLASIAGMLLIFGLVWEVT